MSRTFLGIGAGPIQTGIFVAGAHRGGYDRIVLAEVNPALVTAIRAAASVTVNTAGKGADIYGRVEIYNPAIPEEAELLSEIAAEAVAVSTALPSTAFYRFAAPWLAAGFARSEGAKYVYASENSTTAADKLRQTVGEFPGIHYLDTVIGKMCKIFDARQNFLLAPLAPGCTCGHLVEEFNTIYTADAPGIGAAGIAGLHPKRNLRPFEEAKLYGHNAVHFLLGILAAGKGCRSMDQAAEYPELMACARRALIEECGYALCRKFVGFDDFFEPDRFSAWAEELLTRMVSPELSDSVERVIRDPERKLGWNDRLIGAIRLCRSQGVRPDNLLKALELSQVDWEPVFASWERDNEWTRFKEFLRMG